MKPYIREITLTNFMWEEEKEGKDSPASIHQYDNMKTIWKVQRKTDHSDQKQNKEHKDQQNNNN